MQKNFKKNKQKAMPTRLDSAKRAGRQGFSFLEVMLVVFILGTALTVFIQVISKSMDHSMESRDTIIASGLAQEGAELVKNIRDNRWASKVKAFDSPFPSGSCGIDYNVYKNCNYGSYVLKFDGNFYNHNSGSDSKFSRKIEITAPSTDTRKIISYATWDGASFPSGTAGCNVSSKCVYAQITLTKWGE